MRSWFVLLVAWLAAAAASADGVSTPTRVDINCDPLLPQKQPTTEMETRANAGVQALLKKLPIFSGEANVQAKLTSEDFFKGIPNADRVVESQLRAYLVCQAIRQNPDRSLELVQLFTTQILPIAGQPWKAQSVLPSKPFPANGRVMLSRGPNVFDRGTLVLELGDAAPEDNARSSVTKPTNGTQYGGPHVSLWIVDKPIGRDQSESIPQVFKLQDVRRYNLGSRRFSLKFSDYLDGSGSAEFLVSPLK